MSTTSPNPKVQELARRLLAFEASQENGTDVGLDIAAQVVDEFRLRLIRLAGIVGFRSLLARALTLARAEAPSLKKVQVRADGSLEGFEGLEQNEEPGAPAEARIALVAHLLELLVTFIGEPLTLRLVRDRWPDASMEDADLSGEENNERS